MVSIKIHKEAVDKCLFCGKPKKRWKSTITMETQGEKFKVTVCPVCRNMKTVKDVYLRISELFFMTKKIKTQDYIFPKELADEIRQKARMEGIAISDFIRRNSKKYERYKKIENFTTFRVIER